LNLRENKLIQKRRGSSPKFEVRIDHPVGETFTADTDAFKYTVTSELMHHQVGIDHARLLQFVGDDATDKVGLGGTQGGHQVVQLLLVGGRYSGKATTLLATSSLATTTTTGITGLTGMIGKDLHQQLVTRLLVLVDYSVVQRILVLLQPTSDVVRYLQYEEIAPISRNR